MLQKIMKGRSGYIPIHALYLWHMDTLPQSLLILGRQPELGLAEAESVFGATNVSPLGQQTAFVSRPAADIIFSQLGGSTRLCTVLGSVAATQWERVVNHTIPLIQDIISGLPEGKIRLGMTYIGKGVNPKLLNATGLSIKKTIKATGRSIRIIPNPAAELNTAQVLHNQLTGQTGIELVFIPYNGHTIIARTVVVQDITAYAARDQRRPKRDARVGMLPPKLAQIIINLASGPRRTDQQAVPSTILDPFCGTGVVLQEALLNGSSAYGTDLEPRMIEYSATNLDWLADRHHIPTNNYVLQVGDATKHRWDHTFSTVACETYLGRPLSSLPRPDKLAEIMNDCDTIHRKFLQNLAQQTPAGFRACLAVPAWKTGSRIEHLKTLANLRELGYNRLRFVHVDTNRLLYHRPDQLVARELVVLERI